MLEIILTTLSQICISTLLCKTIYNYSLLCLCVFQDKVAKAQEVKDAAIGSLTQAIEDEKKEQWRAEGRSLLFDAKRVNRADHFILLLQLTQLY